VNLVLVLLIVPLELVELDQHDSLLWEEVAPNRLMNIRHEGDDDREGLGSECDLTTWADQARSCQTGKQH